MEKIVTRPEIDVDTVATSEDYRALSEVEVAYAIENAVLAYASRISGGTIYGFGNGKDLRVIGTSTPADRDDTSSGPYRFEIVLGNDEVTRRFAIVIAAPENESGPTDDDYARASIEYGRLSNEAYEEALREPTPR